MSTGSHVDMDMLHGSISVKILRIAIPLALTSILQQLFNSADMAVVGRFAGSEALAAVGANSSLINLLVNLFVGLSIGTNAVVSRYLGARDEKRANAAAHAAIVLALASGAILAVIGQIFPRPILHLISTPEEILPLASLYLRIYFAGMPFIMLYNFEAALFRSKGDTRSPMVALTIGGAANVILNLIFVIVLKMSVAGVGLATVIANVISSFLLWHKLTRTETTLRIDPKKLALPVYLFREIASIGLPAGFQTMLFSLSNLIVQSAINALGTKTIAANAAEVTYEFYIYYLLNAFTQTNVTFISQNYGAGNLPRCRQAARRSLLLSLVFVVITCGTILLFRAPLMSVFTTDPDVIQLGCLRILMVIGTQWLNAIVDNLTGTLRGLGHSLSPTIVCILSICVFRLFWLFVIYPTRPGYTFLTLVYPISWILSLILMTTLYFYVIQKLTQ